ncbi:MAG: hypothetical protein FWC97_05045 [Treponema sp.]|nr:hypothetical protein [Treponema sp.]
MKKKWLSQGTKLLVFAMFAILCMACATSEPAALAPKAAGITFFREGQAFQARTVAVKDFVGLGLVFVETSATFDSNGRMIEGSEITFDMLMREAHKLGAHAIINIKIDEIHHINKTEDEIVTKTIVYKANALAIKYTDAIIVPVINDTQELPDIEAVQRDWFRSIRDIR